MAVKINENSRPEGELSRDKRRSNKNTSSVS